MLSENALPVMRWQPLQWQAIVTIGGAVISMRIRSHRQPAVHGNFQSVMGGAYLQLGGREGVWIA
jgi:hypothetical protein